MDHGYFKDRISGYLDRELPDYEMEAMRRHLEECGECRAMYEQLERVDLLVERHSGLEDGEYWEAQARKIEERLGIAETEKVTDVRGGRRSWLGWKLGAVAATAAVLVFVAINQTGILRQEEKQETPAAQTGDERGKVGTPPMVAAESIKEAPAQKEEKFGGRERRGAEGARVERPSEEIAKEPEEVAEKPTAAAPESRERAVEDRAAGGTAVEPPQTITKSPARGDEQQDQAAGETVEEELSGMLGEANYSRDSAAKTRVSQPTLSFQADELSTARSGIEYASYQALSPGARIVAGTLTPSGEEELTGSGWVERRDSLQTRWEQMTGAEERLSLSGRSRGKAAFTDVSLVERQLIEAHFTAARMAGDKDPEIREEAIRFLAQYVERVDARYRSTARMYLEQLRPSGEADE